MYSLEGVQQLNISIDQAWDFFSSPKNLEKITPSNMNFKILNNIPEKMYAGLVIRYKIQPFAGYTTNWVTEITQVNKPNFFIDTQLKGPYKIWHHQHHFKAIDAKTTEMKDILHYELPLGFVGKLAHLFFVKKQIHNIFEYRYNEIEKMFNSKP